MAHGVEAAFAEARVLLAVLGATFACSAERPPVAKPPVKAAAPPVASAAAAPAPEPEAVDPDAAGWLGVELAQAPPGEPGVIVRDVLRGSPAERAGLLAGDRIPSVDAQNVARPVEVVHAVSLRHPGERVALGLLRDGRDRLLGVPLGARPDDDALMRSQFVGAPAPRWSELATVQGSLPRDLGGLRGRVVVIDFWASWCVACRLAIPTLNAWHDRYGARGLTVVGITTDPAESALQASVELGIDYAVASDPDGDTSRAYRALALPTLFVLDREGTVRDVEVGYSSERLSQLEAELRDLVGSGT